MKVEPLEETLKGKEHLDSEAWVKDTQQLQVEEEQGPPRGPAALSGGPWAVTRGQRACSSGSFVTGRERTW